jgi:hypothetical protein
MGLTSRTGFERLPLCGFSLEATETAVINGDVLRSEDLVRLTNLISRREKELRAKQRQRLERDKGGQGLSEYLASLPKAG